MNDRPIFLRQLRAVLLALSLASLLATSFIPLRLLWGGKLAYSFLFWNLFLAWIPLLTALLTYGLISTRTRPSLLVATSSLLWFLFFPNAPYIVTDLIHLHERPPVPYWFDIICVIASVQTGLFLGYFSLYLMQEVVRHLLGRAASWSFVLLVLALSSFGIYLGRFLRWNSWNALLEPLDTLRHAATVANPWNNPAPLLFSLTFFPFSLACYAIVYAFTH
ncbi:MAG: DUF1361 domain-containing protein, partial [Verrucomicrobia bacterium]|nr:DUF1361 domain-containing protein [Verrucomicrobiota bacterium]